MLDVDFTVRDWASSCLGVFWGSFIAERGYQSVPNDLKTLLVFVLLYGTS